MPRIKSTKPTRTVSLLLVLLVAVVAFIAPRYSDPLYRPNQAESLRIAQKDLKQEQRLMPSPEGAGSYFSRKRLADGQEQIPSQNIVEAVRNKRAYLSLHRAFNADPWQNLGPDRVGGRTRSFVFHPDDADTLFAAGVSGGIWKSLDAGGNWLPIADDLENIAVVTLAISPNNPNLIVAGTGEGVYIGRPIVRSRGVEGNGIYRSLDGGLSWQAVEQTLNNPDFQFVNKIRAAADGSLFAATIRGVWRSVDDGSSWQLVLDQTNRVGGCNEIELQPGATPNRLLVSCGSFDTAAVYHSPDNGDSWQSVLSETNQGRTTIAFAPSQPLRVYALSAQNQFGPYPYGVNGVYRSDDGGLTWSLISDTSSANFNNRALLATTSWVFDCSDTGQYQDGRLAGGGWYYNLITVDPTDPDRIWTGGLDLWRSDDGGENFYLASFWWAEEQLPSYIHADHHSLVYHPDYDGVNETRLFASNDGGMWHTTNPDAALATNNCNPMSSSVDWRNLNNNYAVTQFYHGSISRDGKILIGGSQDNGSNYRDENGQWREILGGDGSYSAIDPEDPNTLYVSSQYANLYRVQLSSNNYQSIGGDFDFPGLFITPFILDPNNNDRLWMAGLALWRSDNRGDTWVKATADQYVMNYIDGMSALAVQPGNSQLVIAGGTDGYLYRVESALSSNSATSMEKIKLADGYISSINFDRNDPQKVVATVSTFGQPHAWMSSDAGVSWMAIDGPGAEGLPDLPAHDMLVAPHDTNTLYVGTDIGVYHSEDNGQNWLPLTSGMPNVPVEKIWYNRFNQETKLVAFTYGRGAFEALLNDIPNFAPQALVPSPRLDTDTETSVNFEFSQVFDDANDDPLTFQLAGIPAGLSLLNQRTLVGRASEPGTYSVIVTASDGELEAQAELQIVVTEAESPSSSSGGGSTGFWLLTFVLLSIGVRYRRDR